MDEELSSRLEGVVVWRSVASGAQRVLPDGCMDLIWLGNRLVVAGADPVAHVSTVPRGTPCTGLRFAPGLLPRLLGTPASALTGARVPLEDLWGPEEVDRLGHAVAAGADPASVLEDAAAARWWRDDGPDPLVAEVATRLGAGDPVGSVATRVGLSTRQLHRRALEAFGYGPKVLGRVLRLTRALDLARAGTPPAAVAALTGYADQPHLAREVRALAAVPLSDLLGGAQSPSVSGA